jgi:hypothetical protein
LGLLGSEGGGGVFVTATTTESNIISTFVSSSSPPPPKPPNSHKKPDIYTKALEFLASKRVRLQEQRVLHHQILRQYREKHLASVVTVQPPTSDQTNARYALVEFGSNQNETISDDSSTSLKKRSDNFYESSPNLHPYDADEGHAHVLMKAKELNELTSKVVELSFDDDATTRSNSGRSVGGGESIFSKFASVLDLRRVVREIETSVMSSVSCSACKAGKIES